MKDLIGEWKSPAGHGKTADEFSLARECNREALNHPVSPFAIISR